MIKGLPDKLKELRLINHLSQKDVATKLGISPSIVSGYETGERTPSTEVLLAISYLYKCSTDYLLGKVSDKPSIILDVDGLNSNELHVLQSLIDVMKEYGAVNAANLDGGSSSSMYYNDHYEMTSVTLYYSNSSWRLPTGFIVEKR